MTVQRIAASFPAGTWRGIDTAGDDHSPGNVITRDLAHALREEGYYWVARYLRRDGVVYERPQLGGDTDHGGIYLLTLAEVEWILEGGLALLAIQVGPTGRDELGPDLGWQRGEAARLGAIGLGLPQGVHLGCDLEGRAAARAGRSGCLSYLGRWQEAERQGRAYRALQYTGDLSVPLTGRDLHGLPGFDCYWSAAAGPPGDPRPRGNAIEQDPPTRVCGIACDTDTIRQDRYGQGPVLTATPEIVASWYGEALGRLETWRVELPMIW